jgi:hypothetical protein
VQGLTLGVLWNLKIQRFLMFILKGYRIPEVSRYIVNMDHSLEKTCFLQLVKLGRPTIWENESVVVKVQKFPEVSKKREKTSCQQVGTHGSRF